MPSTAPEAPVVREVHHVQDSAAELRSVVTPVESNQASSSSGMQIAREQTSVGGGDRIVLMTGAGDRLLQVAGGNRLVLASAPGVAGGEPWVKPLIW